MEEGKAGEMKTVGETGRKRRKVEVRQECRSDIVHPLINPFANGHANAIAMPPNSYLEELAQLHVMEVLLHYEQHSRCQLCHEEIQGVPFTIWTCRTCYLCEQCICTLFDKHRHAWRRKKKSPFDTVASAEDMYPSISHSQ